MSWNPKFIGGRIEIRNNENAAITIYSKEDGDTFSFVYERRVSRAWWNDDGLCFDTEDGWKIIVSIPAQIPQNLDPMKLFWQSNDVISMNLGDKIRAENNRRQLLYDDIIYLR